MAQGDIAVAFGATLFGAVAIVYGTRHAKQAFTATPPSDNTPAATGGGVSSSTTSANVTRDTNAQGGFIADPGTNFSVNETPEIAQRLAALGKYYHLTIYGISGYRTPQHSVAVGGFADDPHTKGEAADIGVNGNNRQSAAQLTDAMLAKFGLYRPFDPSDDPSNAEVNHVQLLPADGGPVE